MPSKSYPSSGQKICFNNLSDLTVNNTVTLIAFVNDMEYEYLNETKKDIERLGCLAYYIHTSNLDKIFSIVKHPFQSFVTKSRYLSLISEFNFDVLMNEYDKVHFEFTQSLGCYNLFEKYSVYTSLRVHDCFHVALERRAEVGPIWSRLFYRIQANSLKNVELAAAKSVSELICINENDARILYEASGAVAKIDYPKVSELFNNISREFVDPLTILFWGHMARDENQDAVIYFIDEIFPFILKIQPKSRFIICGASPPKSVLNLQSDNVEVTGFVDDPRTYFERASVGIVPLRYGSGIKIKTIEMLAAGINVVTTSVGAEGVRDVSGRLHVEDNEFHFANKILELIKSYE